MIDSFDWELDMAKSRGGLEYYELLNAREEAAKQAPSNEASGRRTGVPLPPAAGNTPNGTHVPQVPAKPAPSKAQAKRKMTAQEAWDAAEAALQTWGRWIKHGQEPPVRVGPRAVRSQFAPPSEGPPPSADSDMAAYVERTPGFDRAKRVLWLAYVDGWQPESRAAVAELEAFKNTLAERLRDRPWTPPPPADRRCEAEISEEREKTKAANLNAPKGSLRNRN